jgi:hypothetical protein
LDADIDERDIDCINRQKRKQYSPGPSLKMSIDAASTVFGLAS